MNPEFATGTSRDILSNPWRAAVVFCLPVAAIVLSGGLNIGDFWRAVVWAACLGVMGVACLVNASRCGRVHCYFTGPFLIVMALAALSYGLGAPALGRAGWNWIGGVTVVGAVLLSCVPELLFGRYLRR